MGTFLFGFWPAFCDCIVGFLGGARHGFLAGAAAHQIAFFDLTAGFLFYATIFTKTIF